VHLAHVKRLLAELIARFDPKTFLFGQLYRVS